MDEIRLELLGLKQSIDSTPLNSARKRNEFLEDCGIWEIRSLIYTTNPVESLNSTIRKYTKTKTVLPDDQAALKAVFLAILNVQKK